MNIVFAGTPQFAVRHLEALAESGHQVIAVITQPDKPGKRGKQLIPGPVKLAAQHLTLPLLQPGKLRVSDLTGYQADVIVVVAYGQILKPAVLEWPRSGCINVHASLLPEWRGAAPVQRTILAGDARTGITIIQMDAGLDTGDILATEATPVEPDDTSESLHIRLADIGSGLLLRVLNQIERGVAKAWPQPSGKVTYAAKIRKQEALIDWTAAPQMIDRQIRALNPDPVACSYLDQSDLDPMRVRFYSAVIKPWPHNRPPGEVLSVTHEGVAVALTSDALIITRMQLPIGKGSVLTGRDLLNARKPVICPGMRFSSSVSIAAPSGKC